MNSVIETMSHIYRLVFVTMYNRLKIYINPDIIDDNLEDEMDIQYHSNKTGIHNMNIER